MHNCPVLCEAIAVPPESRLALSIVQDSLTMTVAACTPGFWVLTSEARRTLEALITELAIA